MDARTSTILVLGAMLLVTFGAVAPTVGASASTVDDVASSHDSCLENGFTPPCCIYTPDPFRDICIRG